MNNIARMRTVHQCLEYFKRNDPDTSISGYYLRTLVKQKKIPVFMSGRKQLINLDKLITYLSQEDAGEEEANINNERIRRVNE